MDIVQYIPYSLTLSIQQKTREIYEEHSIYDEDQTILCIVALLISSSDELCK